TLLRHILEDAGFRVLEARDGLEGVEVFRQVGASLVAVLLDLTMPRLGGLEALAEMRRERADVRALLMSGYSLDDVSQRFADWKLAGFLQKPFAPADVLTCVRRALVAPGVGAEP